MIYIVQNAWPILAATAVGFGFGALYDALLGKPRMRAACLSDAAIKQARGPRWLPLVIAFAAEFWIASIMAGALILAPEEAGEWAMAYGTAFIIWIGFVLPTIVVDHRYGMRPWSLTFIDAGHWLGVFLFQVTVLELIGLVAPTAA